MGKVGRVLGWIVILSCILGITILLYQGMAMWSKTAILLWAVLVSVVGVPFSLLLGFWVGSRMGLAEKDGFFHGINWAGNQAVQVPPFAPSYGGAYSYNTADDTPTDSPADIFGLVPRDKIVSDRLMLRAGQAEEVIDL